MDKWNLMVLKSKLEHSDNLNEVYHTLCSLLDLMIDEATTDQEDEPYEQRPYI